MSQVTLESIETKQTELSELIAQFKAEAAKPVLWVFHKVAIEMHPGERYAGQVLDESGQVVNHLVLMAQRPDKKLSWQAATDWASGLNAQLPTRQMMAAIRANTQDRPQSGWHWTCEAHEHDASYAWGCYFRYGGQDFSRKGYEGSAVAVRRV